MISVKVLNELREQPDILFQADPLADFDEMLAADTPEFGVVQQQIGQLSTLLHHVDAGQAGDALLESGETEKIAQNDPRVVEAQCLIEVADQQKFPCNSSVILFHIHSSRFSLSVGL